MIYSSFLTLSWGNNIYKQLSYQKWIECQTQNSNNKSYLDTTCYEKRAEVFFHQILVLLLGWCQYCIVTWIEIESTVCPNSDLWSCSLLIAIIMLSKVDSNADRVRWIRSFSYSCELSLGITASTENFMDNTLQQAQIFGLLCHLHIDKQKRNPRAKKKRKVKRKSWVDITFVRPRAMKTLTSTYFFFPFFTSILPSCWTNLGITAWDFSGSPLITHNWGIWQRKILSYRALSARGVWNISVIIIDVMMHTISSSRTRSIMYVSASVHFLIFQASKATESESRPSHGSVAVRKPQKGTQKSPWAWAPLYASCSTTGATQATVVMARSWLG